ncbi:hypothetical protein SAMN05216236_102223 [Sedimentitalea nanhaiensis]|uniref:Uncharacterized protein n=2 Tax=Sedimentitalea nanhaiensis TaxID=999627 RepID=A0A1I6YI71_9RHOB|nr:hypothetical protein SAMN05216236_102223 [Sedimentitalea nanhaiensis]
MTDAPRAVNSIVTRSDLGQTAAMRAIFRIIVAGLALGACGPLSLYYRPGVSVSRMETDTTQCEVAALRDAPVANQIRQSPPIYFPGGRYCTGGGCYAAPGYWAGGGVYTVDLNSDLRQRVLDMCMAEKGYQPVSVPRCPEAVARQVPPAATRTMPVLTQGSCAVANKNGTWQIVTPQAPTASE